MKTPSSQLTMDTMEVITRDSLLSEHLQVDRQVGGPPCIFIITDSTQASPRWTDWQEITHSSPKGENSSEELQLFSYTFFRLFYEQQRNPISIKQSFANKINKRQWLIWGDEYKTQRSTNPLTWDQHADGENLTAIRSTTDDQQWLVPGR